MIYRTILLFLIMSIWFYIKDNPKVSQKDSITTALVASLLCLLAAGAMWAFVWWVGKLLAWVF